jgi:hypothetical protein
MIDLTKTEIMSRGMTVNRKWLEALRIINVYNRIDAIDYSYIKEEGFQGAVTSTMDKVGNEFITNLKKESGACMLVESGIKKAGKGYVVITTLFYFQDSYSMNLFVMKCPHKTWDHMKEMFEFTN